MVKPLMLESREVFIRDDPRMRGVEKAPSLYPQTLRSGDKNSWGILGVQALFRD